MPPKVIGPKRALSIELLLFFAYCFFSASWMVGSIVTTDMAQEFGVYTIPSSVNNAISAAKILGNFVAAWILLKLGPKRTVSLSCLLICAVVAAIIALAVAAAVQCPYCIESYTNTCMEMGVTEEQMTEAFHVANAIRGGAALAHGAQMKSLVEKAGLQDEFEIDSAGIGNWHVGQLPDSRMRKSGAEHGYNFNSHARQFQKSDFKKFETIVVMDNENYRAITSMASSQADKDKVVRMADFLTNHREYTTVPDPYYGDYSDFELVITLLEDACQELLNSIMNQ